MDQDSYNLWSLVVQAAGAVAVVAALVIYGIQVKLWRETLRLNTLALEHNAESTRVNAKATELNAFHSAASNLMEIGKLFVDHPAYRKYFYDAVPVSHSSSDYEQAKTIAVVMLDFMSDILVYVQSYPTLYPREPWTRYVRDMFRSSPILCETLAEIRRSGRKWYTEEFFQLMLETSAPSDAPPLPPPDPPRHTAAKVAAADAAPPAPAAPAADSS